MSYRVSFFKELLSPDGHHFRCLQQSIVIRRARSKFAWCTQRLSFKRCGIVSSSSLAKNLCAVRPPHVCCEPSQFRLPEAEQCLYVIQVNKAKPARRPAGVTRARDPKVANGSAQTTMERFARVAGCQSYLRK